MKDTRYCGHNAFGNGPLLELATLREYASALKPRVVIWNFFEGNDFDDLHAEAKSPILREYLDSADFSQHLMQRRGELDAALAADVDGHLRAQFSYRRLRSFLTVSSLRRYITDATRKVQDGSTPTADQDLLAETLRQADNTVRAWGGHLVIVYQPAPWHWLDD